MFSLELPLFPSLCISCLSYLYFQLLFKIIEMVRQEQLLECKCFLKPFEMTSQVMFLYEVLYRK